MGRRIRIVIVPLLIALIVTGAVYFYLGRLETTGGRQPSVPVVIAIKPVAAKTVLTADMLGTKDIPRSFLLPNAVTSLDQAVGQVVNTPLAEGEMLVQGKIDPKAKGAEGLAYVIPPGMRAVTVAVSETVAVAGFPRPGDAVDVYGTMEEPQASTRLALENIPVLAVVNKTEIQTPPDVKSLTSMTLCVTPEQATILVYLTEFGRIRLALRPAGERARGLATMVTPSTLPSAPAASQTVVLNKERKLTIQVAVVKREALPTIGLAPSDGFTFSELSSGATERLQTLISSGQARIVKTSDLTVTTGSPARFSAIGWIPVTSTVGRTQVKTYVEYGLRLSLDLTTANESCSDLVAHPEIRIASYPASDSGPTVAPKVTLRSDDGDLCVDSGGAAAIHGLVSAVDFTLESGIAKKQILPDDLVSDDLRTGAAELVILVRPGS